MGLNLKLTTIEKHSLCVLIKGITVRMVTVEEMKRQLEDEDLKLEQKISLLNDGINSETATVIPVCHLFYLQSKTRLYDEFDNSPRH